MSFAVDLLWKLISRANFFQVGIGFASNFVPVYLAEVAPAHLRGLMIGLYQTGINIGQLIGACIVQGTYAIPNRLAWRIPLITEMVFPIVIGAGIWLMPETPRRSLPALPRMLC